MPQISLSEGRYVFEYNDMVKDNNGNWIIVDDKRTKGKVFIKEFLKFRYIVPEPGEKESDLTRENNERVEHYRTRMEKIKALLDQVAGKGGSVVVLLSVERDRPDSPFLFKVTPCVDFLKCNDEELSTMLGVDGADSLMRSLTVAMRTLHGIGLLHCDLKPDNVFVVGDKDNGFEVKVSDFDDSFLLDDIPSSSDIVGTPEWMSPELRLYHSAEALDAPDPANPLTFASDVYSLGLIYHVYLTGHRPERVGVPSAELDIPRSAVIRKALRKEWYRRTQTCEELLQGLDMVQSMHQDRKTHMKVMRNGIALPKQEVKIVMASSVFKNAECKEKTVIGEILYSGVTDADGSLRFDYGIPYVGDPDVSYLLLLDGKQYPIAWMREGQRNFTAKVETGTGVRMKVVQNGQPAGGERIELYRENDGVVVCGPVLTADETGGIKLEKLENSGQWYALWKSQRCSIEWKNNTGMIVLPSRDKTSVKITVVRGGKPVAGKRVVVTMPGQDGWKKESVSDKSGEVVLTGLPAWYKGNELRYEAVCGDEKKGFVIADASVSIELPRQKGVRVTFAARISGTQELIGGLVVGIKKKESKTWLATSYTKADQPTELGKCSPGKYILAVAKVPEDYAPVELKGGSSVVVTIPENVTSKAIVLHFNRIAPLLDKKFNPPHLKKYVRLLIYPSGLCELYTIEGRKITVSRNNLMIYDLDAYAK